MQQELKFWQGTNFWVALVLAIGGIWVGFPQDEASGAVQALFALISAVGLVREKVKGLRIDWKAWAVSKNTWNYIAAFVTAIVPTIPVDFFQRLNELATAVVGGNWQGIVTALFSIATMLYYIVRKPKP
jgi:hypothetical protein